MHVYEGGFPELGIHKLYLFFGLELLLLSGMKIGNWELIYSIGVGVTIIFCLFGFFETNRELLFEHRASYQPPASWFRGLGMFLVGTISFALTSYVSAKKLTMKPKIVTVIQVVFLGAILLGVCSIVVLYPPNYIIALNPYLFN